MIGAGLKYRTVVKMSWDAISPPVKILSKQEGLSLFFKKPHSKIVFSN